jgi:membrane-associated phospholipid phosphatase
VVFLTLTAAVVVWRVFRRSDLAAVCLVAPLVAGIAELALKEAVDPQVSRAGALRGAFGAGFPSGHTASIAALAVGVSISVLHATTDRLIHHAVAAGMASLVIAAATGSVVGGAHRSLDVVGGVLLGAAAALATSVLVAQLDRGQTTRASSRRAKTIEAAQAN